MRKLRKIIFIIILSLLTSITTGPNLLTTYAFAYSDDRDGDDDSADRDGDDDYSDSDEDDDPNRDYDDGGPEDDDEDDYEDEDYLKDQALEYVFAHRNEDVSDCNNEDEDWTSLPYPNPKTVSKKIWPNRKESFEEREPSDENFDIVTDTIDGIPVTDASKVVKNLDDFFKYQEITKQPHHELMKTFDAEQIEGSDELKGVKLAVDSNRSDYLKYIYAYTYGKGYSKFKGLDANHTPYIKDMAKLWKMKKDSISYKNAKKMSKIEDQIDWGDLGIYKEKDKAYYEKFKEIRNKWKAENAFKEKMNSESLSDDDKEKIIEDKEVKDLIKDVIPFYPHVSDRRNKKILEYANKILNDKESYGKKIDLIDEFAAKETTTSNKNQRENDHQIIKRLIKIERLLEAGKKYEDVPYVTRSILGRFIDVVMEPDFSFDVKFRKIRTVKQMEEELKKFAKGCEIENKEYREEIKNLLKIIRLETDGLDPESVIKSKAILPDIYRKNENKELIKDTIKDGERNHFNLFAYLKLQEIYEDLVHKSNTEQRENDERIYQRLEQMEEAVKKRKGYYVDQHRRLNKDDYIYFRDKIVFSCEPSGQVADRKVKTTWEYTDAWEKFLIETKAQDRENLKNYVKSLKSETVSKEKLKKIKTKCLGLLKNDFGEYGHLYDIAVSIVNGRATSDYIPKINKVEKYHDTGASNEDDATNNEESGGTTAGSAGSSSSGSSSGSEGTQEEAQRRKLVEDYVASLSSDQDLTDIQVKRVTRKIKEYVSINKYSENVLEVVKIIVGNEKVKATERKNKIQDYIDELKKSKEFMPDEREKVLEKVNKKVTKGKYEKGVLEKIKSFVNYEIEDRRERQLKIDIEIYKHLRKLENDKNIYNKYRLTKEEFKAFIERFDSIEYKKPILDRTLRTIDDLENSLKKYETEIKESDEARLNIYLKDLKSSVLTNDELEKVKQDCLALLKRNKTFDEIEDEAASILKTAENKKSGSSEDKGNGNKNGNKNNGDGNKGGASSNEDKSGNAEKRKRSVEIYKKSLKNDQDLTKAQVERLKKKIDKYTTTNKYPKDILEKVKGIVSKEKEKAVVRKQKIQDYIKELEKSKDFTLDGRKKVVKDVRKIVEDKKYEKGVLEDIYKHVDQKKQEALKSQQNVDKNINKRLNELENDKDTYTKYRLTKEEFKAFKERIINIEFKKPILDRTIKKADDLKDSIKKYEAEIKESDEARLNIYLSDLKSSILTDAELNGVKKDCQALLKRNKTFNEIEDEAASILKTAERRKEADNENNNEDDKGDDSNTSSESSKSDENNEDEKTAERKKSVEDYVASLSSDQNLTDIQVERLKKKINEYITENKYPEDILKKVESIVNDEKEEATKRKQEIDNYVEEFKKSKNLTPNEHARVLKEVNQKVTDGKYEKGVLEKIKGFVDTAVSDEKTRQEKNDKKINERLDALEKAEDTYTKYRLTKEEFKAFKKRIIDVEFKKAFGDRSIITVDDLTSNIKKYEAEIKESDEARLNIYLKDLKSSVLTNDELEKVKQDCLALLKRNKTFNEIEDEAASILKTAERKKSEAGNSSGGNKGGSENSGDGASSQEKINKIKDYIAHEGTNKYGKLELNDVAEIFDIKSLSDEQKKAIGKFANLGTTSRKKVFKKTLELCEKRYPNMSEYDRGQLALSYVWLDSQNPTKLQEISINDKSLYDILVREYIENRGRNKDTEIVETDIPAMLGVPPISKDQRKTKDKFSNLNPISRDKIFYRALELCREKFPGLSDLEVGKKALGYIWLYSEDHDKLKEIDLNETLFDHVITREYIECSGATKNNKMIYTDISRILNIEYLSIEQSKSVSRFGKLGDSGIRFFNRTLELCKKKFPGLSDLEVGKKALGYIWLYSEDHDKLKEIDLNETLYDYVISREYIENNGTNKEEIVDLNEIAAIFNIPVPSGDQAKIIDKFGKLSARLKGNIFGKSLELCKKKFPGLSDLEVGKKALNYAILNAENIDKLKEIDLNETLFDHIVTREYIENNGRNKEGTISKSEIAAIFNIPFPLSNEHHESIDRFVKKTKRAEKITIFSKTLERCKEKFPNLSSTQIGKKALDYIYLNNENLDKLKEINIDKPLIEYFK